MKSFFQKPFLLFSHRPTWWQHLSKVWATWPLGWRAWRWQQSRRSEPVLLPLSLTRSDTACHPPPTSLSLSGLWAQRVEKDYRAAQEAERRRPGCHQRGHQHTWTGTQGRQDRWGGAGVLKTPLHLKQSCTAYTAQTNAVHNKHSCLLNVNTATTDKWQTQWTA